MRKTNNSYFARHKESFKPNKSTKIQNLMPRENDLKAHQTVADKNALPQRGLDLPSHSFVEEKTEEQKVYEEYKEIQAKYDLELKELEE